MHEFVIVLNAVSVETCGCYIECFRYPFFDVNEGRGWRTNSGKPVDDWKKLAAVWDRNERPKDATPPARTEPKANAVGKIPSVEEVMAKWGCDRETAQGYIDENMY